MNAEDFQKCCNQTLGCMLHYICNEWLGIVSGPKEWNFALTSEPCGEKWLKEETRRPRCSFQETSSFAWLHLSSKSWWWLRNAKRLTSWKTASWKAPWRFCRGYNTTSAAWTSREWEGRLSGVRIENTHAELRNRMAYVYGMYPVSWKPQTWYSSYFVTEQPVNFCCEPDLSQLREVRMSDIVAGCE